MTKLAAILPALTPALVGSVGMGLAATALDSYGQRQHGKRQEEANNSWLAFQERAKREADLVEDARRGEAYDAFNANADANSREGRDEVINAETDRLTDAFTANLDNNANSLVDESQSGRDEIFDDAMAASLAKATGDARKRMAALAKATSYGGGSQFGMGQSLAQAADKAGSDIGFTNLIRRDNTDLLRMKQARQPEFLEYQQSPLVPLMKAGSMIIGGAGGDFWTGSLGGGGAPAASLRPQLRPTTFSSAPSTASTLRNGTSGWFM